MQVIDPDTGEVRHNLPSGEDPEQFALAPDGRTLFIANEENATTTVVDAQTRKVLAQIDVGIEPEGVAVSPDGRTAVTTSETTNMVHWIDTAAWRRWTPRRSGRGRARGRSRRTGPGSGPPRRSAAPSR